MGIKALKEQRNDLYSELDEVRSTGSVEQLGNVLGQIENLTAQIDGENKRDKGVAVRMESQEQKQQNEEKRNFESYLRGEERAMATTADGNAVLPESIANQLILKMEETSPIFQNATKYPAQSGSLKIARENSASIGFFVSEGQNVPEDNIDLDFVSLDQKRVGATVILTNQLINDNSIDLVGYSVEKLSRQIAKAIEGSALTGNGGNEFNGIVNDPDVKTITLTDAVDMDVLVDMHTSINPQILDNAAFYMSRKFYNQVALLKDGNGQYFLQNGVVNGKPTYTLFGSPVHISDSMTEDKPCVFANVKEAYAVMIKSGINVIQVHDSQNALRGSTQLVMDGYLDGAVQNPDAAVTLVSA